MTVGAPVSLSRSAVRCHCRGVGGAGSGLSTDASGTRRSSSSSGGDFSTDVRVTRRVMYTKVREGRDNQENLHGA